MLAYIGSIIVFIVILWRSKQRHDRLQKEEQKRAQEAKDKAFKARMDKQARAIRKYAKSLRMDVNNAGLRWAQKGCAERWHD